VKQVPGTVALAGRERLEEEDQPENGAAATDAEQEPELAADRPLDEALMERGGHRGLSPVEPVALGAGGIPVAAPAGSGPSGVWPCSFRTWFTMAQRSLGR
jgi:hypothetical protein